VVAGKSERNREIRQRKQAGESQAALAAEYGITPARIGVILKASDPKPKSGPHVGLPERNLLIAKGRWLDGTSEDELAAEHRLNKYTIRKIAGSLRSSVLGG
jgi:hypothetical protein